MFVWHYSILLPNINSVKKINNTLRIIGGRYRGKKITFPLAEGLRPTSDRIRETLFNWLMHDIRDARCLDVFAGSGALGFEAYSRGAASVVFLEKDATVFRHLQQSAATFQPAPFNIIQTTASDYLPTQTANQFDIVFVDPPFAHLDLFACIHQFETSDLLVQNGLLYVESPHEIPLNPQFWRQLKLKQAGQVTYGLYQKMSHALTVSLNPSQHFEN